MSKSIKEVTAQYSDKDTREAKADIGQGWLSRNPDMDSDDAVDLMDMAASGKIKSYTKAGGMVFFWSKRNVSPEEGMEAHLVNIGIEIMYDGEELEEQFQNEYGLVIDEKSTNF